MAPHRTADHVVAIDQHEGARSKDPVGLCAPYVPGPVTATVSGELSL